MMRNETTRGLSRALDRPTTMTLRFFNTLFAIAALVACAGLLTG